MEALTWEAEVEDISACVIQNSAHELAFRVFNFSDKESIAIKTKLMKEGNYRVAVTETGSSESMYSDIEIRGTVSRVELTLNIVPKHFHAMYFNDLLSNMSEKMVCHCYQDDPCHPSAIPH